jgi:hypothetical protein
MAYVPPLAIEVDLWIPRVAVIHPIFALSPTDTRFNAETGRGLSRARRKASSEAGVHTTRAVDFTHEVVMICDSSSQERGFADEAASLVCGGLDRRSHWRHAAVSDLSSCAGAGGIFSDGWDQGDGYRRWKCQARDR